MAEFECHITLGEPASVELEKIVEFSGWSFSSITGDPVLGLGQRCYATKHYANKQTAIKETVFQTLMFVAEGLHVVRAKVEEVVFDTRRNGGLLHYDS